MTRYQIVFAVYVATLLVLATATLGPGGLFAGMLVCLFWSLVFTSRSRPGAFLYASLAVIVVSFPLLLPGLGHPRDLSRRMSCANNLKEITWALHNYHDQFGSFPPAYVADELGQPVHSWRVLLLPFLDEQPLYDQYDFGEPWDGRHNSQLLDNAPRVYVCPTTFHDLPDRRGCTSYFAVVDPATVWPAPSACRFQDISDGTSNTLTLVESNQPVIPWLEPRDVGLSEALEMLDSVTPAVDGCHHWEDFLHEYYDGRNVAFADGSVRFVNEGIDREVWSGLLRKDDGGAWNSDDTNPLKPFEPQLKVGNCLRLALFVVLALVPLPWVWLRPAAETGSVAEANDEQAT